MKVVLVKLVDGSYVMGEVIEHTLDELTLNYCMLLVVFQEHYQSKPSIYMNKYCPFQMESHTSFKNEHVLNVFGEPDPALIAYFYDCVGDSPKNIKLRYGEEERLKQDDKEFFEAILERAATSNTEIH